MATEPLDLPADPPDDDDYDDGDPGIAPPFEREVSEEVGDDDDGPRWSVGLARVASLAILFDGLFLVSSDSLIGTVGAGALGLSPGVAGFLGIAPGLLVFLFAVAMLFDLDAHVGYGVAILLTSLVSLVSGGGFILGTILGIAAGVLAIQFEPAELPEEEPDAPLREERPLGPRRGPACGTELGARDRRCPRCGDPQAAG